MRLTTREWGELNACAYYSRMAQRDGQRSHLALGTNRDYMPSARLFRLGLVRKFSDGRIMTTRAGFKKLATKDAAFIQRAADAANLAYDAHVRSKEALR